jgi:VWFA-related protein
MGEEVRVLAKHDLLLKVVVLLSVLLLAAPAAVQLQRGQESAGGRRQADQITGKQLRGPNRPAKPLFEGKQGKQRTEIHFDPGTRLVTLRLQVQDPNGYFIPNIHRDNFVVYENGVRQQNATVDVEHAPVTLVLLLELGGRFPALNQSVATEVTRDGRELIDVLGPEDKVAIWKYADTVQKLTDFSQDRQKLEFLFTDLGTPAVSETNLYDAVIYTVEQMHSVTGRKAVVLISSGVDTFSKATYQDVLNMVRDSDTPVYVLSLARVLRNLVETEEPTRPVAKIDWSKANRELQEIARASGGRAYSPESAVELSAIYDDLMENLKVRYVITYRSSNDTDLNTPRTVRVELVNPTTGEPLRIADKNGSTIPSNVIFQDTYIPIAASK